MIRVYKYHITYLYVLCALFTQSAVAQELDVYKDADSLFYSGEITWRMDYEVFVPAPAAIKENKPIGLSDGEFESWIKKQQLNRKQVFEIRAYFRGENLRFEILSEPGDILPTKCDRVLTFNKANTTLIDNVLANLSRAACGVPFREYHYSTFYISPRACGYDGPRVLKMARKVKDRHSNEPTDFKQYEDPNDGNAIVVYGTFPESGQVLLAELIPDSEYGHVFQSIKSVNPTFRHVESIQCSSFKPYDGSIVFPDKTVVSHFVGGTIESLDNADLIDRITLTVIQAEFNKEIDDELFNPGCPTGYVDLQDVMRMRKNVLTNE